MTGVDAGLTIHSERRMDKSVRTLGLSGSLVAAKRNQWCLMERSSLSSIIIGEYYYHLRRLKGIKCVYSNVRDYSYIALS